MFAENVNEASAAFLKYWTRTASEAEKRHVRTQAAVEKDVARRLRRGEDMPIPTFEATAIVRLLEQLAAMSPKDIDDLIRQAEYDEAEPGSPLRIHEDGLRLAAELTAQRKHAARVTITAKMI